MQLQGAAVPLRRLSKPRNPGVAARSTGLSAVAPVPISPFPHACKRPELARRHESRKKVSDLTDVGARLLKQLQLLAQKAHCTHTM